MIAQLAIACTGVVAVALTQFGSERGRRVACLFGLAAQPFWVYATVAAQQWGMFAVSLLYTAVWGWSTWVQWLRPRLLPPEVRYVCGTCIRRDVPGRETVLGSFYRFHLRCGKPVATQRGPLASKETE